MGSTFRVRSSAVSAALPLSTRARAKVERGSLKANGDRSGVPSGGSAPQLGHDPGDAALARSAPLAAATGDRKSTRLNSSHVKISYAVFCLKKKKQKQSK